MVIVAPDADTPRPKVISRYVELSVARKVRLVAIAPEGVPVIAPVEAFKESPVGREPDVIVQVTEPEFPTVASVVL